MVSMIAVILIFAWYAGIFYYFLINTVKKIETQRLRRPNRKSKDRFKAVKGYQSRAEEEYERRLEKNSWNPIIIGIGLILLTFPIHSVLLFVIDRSGDGGLITSGSDDPLNIGIYLFLSAVDEVTLGFFELFPQDWLGSGNLEFNSEAFPAAVFSIVLSRLVLVSIGIERLLQSVGGIFGRIVGEHKTRRSLKKLFEKAPEEVMRDLDKIGWWEEAKITSSRHLVSKVWPLTTRQAVEFS